VDTIKATWDRYILLLEKNEIRFIEEAHFLSLVYNQVGIKFGTGNLFVRRIWTQVLHFNNRTNSDSELVMWHLPAEKRFGIRRLADRYLKDQLLSWPTPGSSGMVMIRKELGIVRNSPKKKFLDLTRSFVDRFLLPFRN
jgi:hypothetical protein